MSKSHQLIISRAAVVNLPGRLSATFTGRSADRIIHSEVSKLAPVESVSIVFPFSVTNN
jgi:hypothetical protein